jgi:hypothetical protein
VRIGVVVIDSDRATGNHVDIRAGSTLDRTNGRASAEIERRGCTAVGSFVLTSSTVR